MNNPPRIIRPQLIIPDFRRLPLASHRSRPRLCSVRTREPAPVMLPGPKAGLRGRYRIQVLDARSGRVVHERPWASNLILDQGLNQIASNRYGTLTNACAVGTGTTPVVRDSSGVATITVTGTNAVASAAFFEAGDVGRLLKLDSGGEAYISVFNSTTDVDLATAPGNSGPEDGAVWYVDQTGLTAEAKRTVTYLTGAGNCGASTAGNVRTYKRTYDFSAEVGNQNYTELGWAVSGGAGANLFSRVLISGGAVSVLIGQQLRVVYELELTVTPTTPLAGATTITGWPVAPATVQDGDMQLTSIFQVSTNNWSGITTGGVVEGAGQSEPGVSSANSMSLRLCAGATFPAFGSAYNEVTQFGAVFGASNSYTGGSFTRSMDFVFGLTDGNSTAIRGLHFGSAGFVSTWVFIYDEAQTKANTHTLTITLPQSWQRTLTNP